MLILIEGVDCVGKTHFVQTLAKELPNATVLHKGPPTEHPVREYELPLQDYRPSRTQHVICDRWYLGELVYGPLLRGGTQLDPACAWHIEQFLNARGAILVHLVAPERLLAERFERRGDDLINVTDLPALVESYAELVYETTLPVVQGFVNRQFGRTVLGLAQAQTTYALALGEFPTYVGDARPDVLLLGETRNLNKLSEFTTAFSPLSPSGRYLIEALFEYPFDVEPPLVGLANALEENVHDLWCALDRPLVVALGHAAHRELERHTIPHGALPHPAYVRRFHAGPAQQTVYGRRLYEVAASQEQVHTWRP